MGSPFEAFQRDPLPVCSPLPCFSITYAVSLVSRLWAQASPSVMVSWRDRSCSEYVTPWPGPSFTLGWWGIASSPAFIYIWVYLNCHKLLVTWLRFWESWAHAQLPSRAEASLLTYGPALGYSVLFSGLGLQQCSVMCWFAVRDIC